MVEIVKGKFGYFNGKRIIQYTQADGPQSWDPELEARLVKKGIARYVDAPEATETESEVKEEVTESAPVETSNLNLAGMTKAQLIKMAEENGIDALPKMTKNQLIDAILSKPPARNAEDAVV